MKISYRQIILVLFLVFIPTVPPAIASSLLVVAFLILFSPVREEKLKVFLDTWPLIALTVIGLIVGPFLFFENGSIYFYLRDVFYFLMPVLGICFGYLWALRVGDSIEVLKAAVLSALIASIFNYGEFIFGLRFLSGDLLGTRYEYQLNSGMALIGFAIMHFCSASGLHLFERMTSSFFRWSFFVLVILSLSRTNIGAMLIIFLLPTLSKIFSARIQLLALVPTILLVIFAGSLLAVAVPENVSTNFFEKVLNSGSEVVVQEYEGAVNINQYWRSYEAFLGLEKYFDAGLAGLMFGQGFGSYASASHVFETKFQYIPIFHIGFITILLKAGIVGIFLFFAFLGRIIRPGFPSGSSPEDRFHALLSIGLVWVIVIHTYAVHGLYTPKINVLLLFLVGCIFSFKRKANTTEQDQVGALRGR